MTMTTNEQQDQDQEQVKEEEEETRRAADKVTSSLIFTSSLPWMPSEPPLHASGQFSRPPYMESTQ